uniref:Uncharacterized protein n=1 Tax=Alexandrium catenella TaxID=2925 RepID=A0A7S1W8J0_ALECA|mmetsp:Transcript_43088/g.116174  ORF Transcript_43088/g.116174 Transcript_43088/m.116174 type:complete len:226 (+) Transcript_43088:54-731(+)
MLSGASDASPCGAPRRRPLLLLACTGCVLLSSRQSPGAPPAGSSFAALRGSAPRTLPSVLRRAGSADDDFDFGDMPQTKAEGKAAGAKDAMFTAKPVVEEEVGAKTLPPVAKVASKAQLQKDMEEGESYEDIDYNEPEDQSSVFAFASVAALIFLVVGYLAYTAYDQGSANSGGAPAKRQVVKAVYDTYFDEDDQKKSLIQESKLLADSTVQSSAEQNVEAATAS